MCEVSTIMNRYVVSDWGMSCWVALRRPLLPSGSASIMCGMTVLFFPANHRVMGAREEMWEHCKLQVVWWFVFIPRGLSSGHWCDCTALRWVIIDPEGLTKYSANLEKVNSPVLKKHFLFLFFSFFLPSFLPFLPSFFLSLQESDLNSRPWDYESHTLPIKPARCP